jgi:hypothetical protein
MRRLLFSQLSPDDIEALVRLDNRGIRPEPWDALSRGELTETEQRIVDYVVTDLRHFEPSLVNEATVWGRAIFPLLVLAEAEGVQAQADVPLSARLGDVELAGSADGALGRPYAGALRVPFLIVVEAKRGVEGYNPVTQLHGEMLAAAGLNAHATGESSQRIHGCYTIGANWTFVRGDVDGLGEERPTFAVTSSQEISEKLEAATIVKILKSIVAEHRRRGMVP